MTIGNSLGAAVLLWQSMKSQRNAGSPPSTCSAAIEYTGYLRIITAVETNNISMRNAPRITMIH
jgi:hypothetical protein